VKPHCTVIVSERPLLCEGLGCLIDETLETTIIKAPDKPTCFATILETAQLFMHC